MRYRLFLTVLCLFISAAPSAFGLTPQECVNIKDVYGWVPNSCQQQVANTPKVEANTISEPSQITATNPTSQQVEDHVFFPSGGTRLDQKALAQIDLLTQLLNAEILGDACLALVGHSDTSGGEVANMQVAQARADVVGAAIRKRLEDPKKVERVLAAGETLPLKNLSPRSRWQRRVEIRARKCALSM